ncbi:hypothetical protein HDZ31DRAFT_37473 [Schizophyllum fasciatum]
MPFRPATASSLKSLCSDSLASMQAVEDMLMPRALSRASSCETVRATCDALPSDTSDTSDSDGECAPAAPLILTLNTDMQVLAAARWTDEYELEMLYGDGNILGVYEDSDQYYLAALESEDEDEDEAMSDAATEGGAHRLAAEPSLAFSDATEPDYDAINYVNPTAARIEYVDAPAAEDDAMDTTTDAPAYVPLPPSPPAGFPRAALRPEMSLRRSYMTKRLRVSTPSSPLGTPTEDASSPTSPLTTGSSPFSSPSYHEIASSPTLASLTCPECGIQCASLEAWVTHAKCYRRLDQ